MINAKKRIDSGISLRSIGKIMLFIYIVLSFVTSSGFLPSIFHSLSLYAMVFIAIVCFCRGQRIIINKYLVWYLLLASLFFSSVLYTPIADWWSTIYAMMVIFALAFSFSCFIKDRREMCSVIFAFAVGSTLLIIMLLFTGRLHEDDRLGTTLMSNANIFASMYMISIMFSIWYVLYGEGKIYRLFLIISIVLNFYALLLSGGRKYIVVPFIFVYILLLFKTDKKGKKHVFFYTILIGVVFLILYLLMMNIKVLYDSIGHRIEGFIGAFLGEGGDGSSEIRKKMMVLAWERGWDNPLFGHGVDSFKHLNNQVHGMYYYSHNNWVEIWYNHGIVGMFLYYGFYVIMVFTSMKKRKDDPGLSSFIIASVISIFIFEFGAVTYSADSIQMLLCVCAIVQNFKSPEKEKLSEYNSAI